MNYVVIGLGVLLDDELDAFGHLLYADFLEVLYGVVGFEKCAQPAGEGVAALLQQVAVGFLLVLCLLAYLQGQLAQSL